jgi:hypothetical protein
LAIAAAALIMIISRRWPARSDRSPRSGHTEDQTAMWQALDAGFDPTEDAERADPDVHIPSSPDTMGNADQSQQSSRRE